MTISPSTAAATAIANSRCSVGSFHHFHSIAHEVLGVVAGSATLVLGVYPDGMDWDICRGEPAEHDEAVRRIRAVPLPASDPVQGRGAGALAVEQVAPLQLAGRGLRWLVRDRHTSATPLGRRRNPRRPRG